MEHIEGKPDRRNPGSPAAKLADTAGKKVFSSKLRCGVERRLSSQEHRLSRGSGFKFVHPQ